MVLDNFRTIELIWDKANKSIIKTIKTASSDTTGRYLSVKILDGGQEVALSGATLQLYWEHPNFNTSGTDNFNAVNNGGLFKVTFSDEMLTNIGELNAHLILTLSDGKITSDGFPIEVVKGASSGVVIPSSGESATIKAVYDAMEKLQDIDVQLAQKANKSEIGTPLLATNIDEMIDTERVYVNTTDGEWYTFNGSTWVSGGTYNSQGIADKSVSEIKTTFMEVSDEKDVTVNLIPDVLGTLGVYYDPASGKPVSTDATMTYKATGKITKGDFSTMKSFGVNSWIFYNSENIRISSQELSSANEGVVTEVAFPADTAYVIGNIRDTYFPVDDPDRSASPIGVATATIVKTSRKYNIKDLIIEDENLSEEIKVAIEKEKQSEYAGKVVVNLGDSIIEGTNPSISDVIADELGSTTINGGFGGCMMSTHPNAEFAKFSMTAVADAITTGNWSIQEDATAVPAGFKNTVARLKAVDWTQVYCVVISYGTNDWLNSNPLDNTNDLYDKTAYLGALRYSIRLIRQKYPHIKILVTAPIFRSTHDRLENAYNWRNGNQLRLIEFVDGLDKVRREVAVPVADTFFGLGINQWNEKHYFPANDGTHPNAIGRQLLGQKIASTIRYVY